MFTCGCICSGMFWHAVTLQPQEASRCHSTAELTVLCVCLSASTHAQQSTPMSVCRQCACSRKVLNLRSWTSIVRHSLACIWNCTDNSPCEGLSQVSDCDYVQVKDPVSFTTAWLTAHIANAQSLGKPFIVEEFGKSINARDPTIISTVRDPVFTAVYDMLNSNLKADGIFKGKLQFNGSFK